MKRLTLLGLCAVAATAWTALLGTGSASATVLCLKWEVTCPKEEHHPVETEILATLKAGTSMRITDTFGFTGSTCTESTIKGITENTGSATETIGIGLESLTFGKCTDEPVVLENGELELDYLSGSSTEGTLTVHNLRITVEILDADCVYGALENGSDIGKATSRHYTTGALGTFQISGALYLIEGSNCPAHMVWLATYTVTKPEIFYIKSKRA